MKPSEPIPTLSQRCSGPQEFKGIAHRTAAPVGKSFNGSLWNPLPGFVPGVLRAGPKSFAKIIGGLDFSLLFDLCTSNKIGANRESQKRVVEPVAIWGPEPNTSHSVASTGMAPERRSVVGFWVYQLSYICLPQDWGLVIEAVKLCMVHDASITKQNRLWRAQSGQNRLKPISDCW